MAKVIAYARTPEDVATLIEFGIERNHVADKVAEGDLAVVLSLLDKGDTLVLETIESFNTDGWGGAIVAGKLLEHGITIVTRKENLVLKDDINSSVMMSMTCMTIMMKTHPSGQQQSHSDDTRKLESPASPNDPARE